MMKQLEQFEHWDLILRTRSPIHIGSGAKYSKHDYCYFSQQQLVAILDQDAFFHFLIQNNLVDAYEQFVFSSRDSLRHFLLRECGLSMSAILDLSCCQLDASDALAAGQNPREIRPFLRHPDGKAYVSGSSVKGALRTVLLTEMICREKKGVWPWTEPIKNKQGSQMLQLEGTYLNTLSLKRDTKTGQVSNDPVNSLLRGISLSDSTPISEDQLILCGKTDVRPDGTQQTLPILRECVRPGTDLHFDLTLDQSILKGRITAEGILHALEEWNCLYQRYFTVHFVLPKLGTDVSHPHALILGGGSGFFSKTLTYPYLGREKGLEESAQIMQGLFSAHGHRQDSELGISPHMMKYTRYHGKLYPYGFCEVILQ